MGPFAQLLLMNFMLKRHEVKSQKWSLKGGLEHGLPPPLC